MKSILKQTSWLFLAQALGRIIGFFYTIFLARNLGVSDFGLYSAALAYFSLISSIADFGFNRFLIREVARDNQKIPQLLYHVSLLRLTLTSVVFASFAAGLYFLDPDKLRVHLSLLATLAVLPQSIALSLDAVFVALKRLQFSSLALLVLNLSTTLFGIVLISGGFGVPGAMVALILGQLVYLCLLLFLTRLQKIKAFARIQTSTLKKVISGSLPYSLLAILGLLYFRVDLLLLTYLRGNFEAGIYGAAYKFLEAMVFVPSSLATALFPILARLHEGKPQAIRPLYFKSLKLMLSLGIVLALSYILILPTIIKILLPNYFPAIEAIKVLALAIPFMFLHIPGAQVLLSTDKYLKPVIFLSFLTLSFNVILNLVFIPQFGFLAASWVTVASEILTLLVFFRLLWVKVLTK